MAIGMHREQIGCCADDTNFRRSCPKQREQIGECADDTHFWRSRPKQREQIGECADDTHFWRSRLTHKIATFNVHFVNHCTKISNLGSFGKALTIDI